MAPKARPRTVIAEDEALMREGLAIALGDAGHEVAGVAATAEELIRLVAAEQPDLVISDVRMPPGHSDEGLRAAIEIRRRWPELSILILSHHVHRQAALRLLATGYDAGIGYLLKQRVADLAGFRRDLDRVMRGQVVIDPEVLRSERRTGGLGGLTDRQREVLELIAQGLSNERIAERLEISPKSVARHVSHIYVELQIPDRTEDHRRVLAVLRYLAAADSGHGPA